MTITHISDTHGVKLKTLQNYPADVLVHSGDFTQSRVHYETDTEEFLEWLSAQPFAIKILVAGNHDFYPYYSLSKFIKLLEKYPTIHYLQDSGITIYGVKFYGIPWTPPFYNWAFMANEVELKTHFNKIPDDTTVLITHGPADGTLDRGRSGYSVGSTALKTRIAQLSIKAHLFGHIHGTYSAEPIVTSAGYQASSASIMTEAYKPANNPVTIQITCDKEVTCAHSQ